LERSTVKLRRAAQTTSSEKPSYRYSGDKAWTGCSNEKKTSGLIWRVQIQKEKSLLGKGVDIVTEKKRVQLGLGPPEPSEGRQKPSEKEGKRAKKGRNARRPCCG